MPIACVRILGRLIAGIGLLAALLLCAPPAQAHEPANGRSVHRAGLVQSMSPQLSAGETIPNGGCRGGMSCCVVGQCSMVSIAMPTEGYADSRLQSAAFAYAGMIMTTTRGLRPGPATPPPRVTT